MSKRTHQIFFAGIIINLITILIFVPLSSIHFILCLLSLIMMLILPLGIKGGMYHRIVSTAGLIVYLSLLLLLY